MSRLVHAPVQASMPDRKRVLYEVADSQVIYRGVNRAAGRLVQNIDNEMICGTLTIHIRTRDLGIDMDLQSELIRRFFSAISINLMTKASGENYYAISVILNLRGDDAQIDKKITDAVIKLNRAAAVVYEQKEAGQFDGSDFGRAPIIDLVEPVAIRPLVEGARS